MNVATMLKISEEIRRCNSFDTKMLGLISDQIYKEFLIVNNIFPISDLYEPFNNYITVVFYYQDDNFNGMILDSSHVSIHMFNKKLVIKTDGISEEIWLNGEVIHFENKYDDMDEVEMVMLRTMVELCR